MPLAYSSSDCSEAHPGPGSSTTRLHPNTQALQTTDVSHGGSNSHIRCGTVLCLNRRPGLLHDDCMRASPQKAVNGADLRALLSGTLFHSISKDVKQKSERTPASRSPSSVPRCGFLEAGSLRGWATISGTSLSQSDSHEYSRPDRCGGDGPAE